MADYMTFLEIITAVEGKVSQSASMRDIVKSAINMVYLNEILEADDLYPMFWLRKMDDSLNMVGPSVITGITQADPGVITTSAAHELAVNDIVSVYSIKGMTELNNRIYKVSVVPSTVTLSLSDVEGLDNIDTTSFTAYTSGGTISHRGLTLATSGVDVKNLLQVAFHDYRGELVEITPEEAEERTSYWNKNTSRPQRYMHRKFYTNAGVETNQLWVFPGSDTDYDMRYWAEVRSPRLSADTDVPDLPPQFHDTIVAGAIVRLIDSQVQVENAIVWPNLYNMQLENLRAFNRAYYQRNLDTRMPAPYLLGQGHTNYKTQGTR